MRLLDDELRTRLPPLHSQEGELDPVVYAKFFLPGTDRTWYALEGEARQDEFIFFGFVAGPESKFDFFLLTELESIRGPSGLRVERDRMFPIGRLTEIVPAPDD
jgi:Protein of unknown function (DUF2958)